MVVLQDMEQILPENGLTSKHFLNVFIKPKVIKLQTGRPVQIPKMVVLQGLQQIMPENGLKSKQYLIKILRSRHYLVYIYFTMISR